MGGWAVTGTSLESVGMEQVKPQPETYSLVCPCYSRHGGVLLGFVGQRKLWGDLAGL